VTGEEGLASALSQRLLHDAGRLIHHSADRGRQLVRQEVDRPDDAAAVVFGEDLNGGVVVARPTFDDGIDGQPLVSAEEGRKRIIVCLEAERAVAEGREIALRF
jgi:hypothetical protein